MFARKGSKNFLTLGISTNASLKPSCGRTMLCSARRTFSIFFFRLPAAFEISFCRLSSKCVQANMTWKEAKCTREDTKKNYQTSKVYTVSNQMLRTSNFYKKETRGKYLKRAAGYNLTG